MFVYRRRSRIARTALKELHALLLATGWTSVVIRGSDGLLCRLGGGQVHAVAFASCKRAGLCRWSLNDPDIHQRVTLRHRLLIGLPDEHPAAAIGPYMFCGQGEHAEISLTLDEVPAVTPWLPSLLLGLGEPCPVPLTGRPIGHVWTSAAWAAARQTWRTATRMS